MGEEDTARHFRSGDVPVLATPRLIAMCEEAALPGDRRAPDVDPDQRGHPGPVRPSGPGRPRQGGPGRGDPGQGGGPPPHVHRLGGPPRARRRRPRRRRARDAGAGRRSHLLGQGRRRRRRPDRGTRPRHPVAVPGGNGAGGGDLRHIRPVLGQLGRHGVQHPAHLRALRFRARLRPGTGHRRGRGLQRGDGPSGQPSRRAPSPVDRTAGVVGAAGHYERGAPAVGLCRRPGGGGDRRGQYRHRHERGGVAPPDGQPGRTRPVPCPLQYAAPSWARPGPGSCSMPASRGAGSGPASPWWHWWSGCGRSPPTPARRSGTRTPVGHAGRVHPVQRIRRDGLLILLVVFALAEVTEGGVDTWGVLYLRNHLATGVLLGAGAYVVGQVVAATTRAQAAAWSGASRPVADWSWADAWPVGGSSSSRSPRSRARPPWGWRSVRAAPPFSGPW